MGELVAQRLKGHGEMERIWNWIQENSRDGKLWWAEFHAESMNPHKLVELSGLPVDGIP